MALADEFDRRLHAAGSPSQRSKAFKQVLTSLNEEAGEKYDEEVFNGLVVALRKGMLKPS